MLPELLLAAYVQLFPAHLSCQLTSSHNAKPLHTMLTPSFFSLLHTGTPAHLDAAANRHAKAEVHFVLGSDKDSRDVFTRVAGNRQDNETEEAAAQAPSAADLQSKRRAGAANAELCQYGMSLM